MDVCKYKSGKCKNPRACGKDGKLLKLCEMHRQNQNAAKRRSTKKRKRSTENAFFVLLFVLPEPIPLQMDPLPFWGVDLLYSDLQVFLKPL